MLNWRQLRDLPQVTLYYRRSEWEAKREMRASAHFMRRAWERLDLDAILTVEGKPAAYFKSVTRNDPQREAEYQRLLWNQGVANLLVVHDANHVRVYSAHATPSNQPIVGGDDERLVESLNLTSFVLREFALRLETGQYYRDHSPKFQAKASVDYLLLENLAAASEKLSSGPAKLDRSTCHALLGRLLFVCYLRDREILGNRYMRTAGIRKPGTIRDFLNDCSPHDAISALYSLFQQVQRDFNGSLFDDDLQAERRKVQPAHIDTLRQFLNGEELRTGQTVLNFPAYDFSLIPIETISAIYETFLRSESEERQTTSGSFYTPRYLAEMTVDVATESWDTLLDKRCLDPACGSGIFLVILFNRMAEEWRACNPTVKNTTRARQLRDLLSRNLWGVDVNPTACRITCFSLYLAFLDQLQPRDISNLRKELRAENHKVLPPLLALPEKKFANTPTPRIFAANFFDERLPLRERFHLVIGNPPWVGRNQPRDHVLERWVFSNANPSVSQASGNRQELQSRFLPQHQSAHAFMWKAPLHLQPDGRACLILPSKVWLNQTDDFQSEWLRRFAVERVLQLADYRRILFENAICPATVVLFRPSPVSDANMAIAYDVPKVDKGDPRQALITIASEDRKFIALGDLLTAATQKQSSLVWKQLLWGTARDVQFLARLLRMPTLGDLAGEPDEGKRWVKGEGFQPNISGKSESPQPPFWRKSDLFISANSSAIDLFLTPQDCESIGGKFQSLHRSRDQRIYRPPLVLVNRGFTKFAYADFPLLFRDALKSIAGTSSDEPLLQFLAGVLNSDLAKYFLFHTSPNWGVERDQIHFPELLRLPFPLPEQTSNRKRCREIVRRVAGRLETARSRSTANPLAREWEVQDAKREINSLVTEYYGVAPWEQVLIEDTVRVFEPSSTPASLESDIPTLKVSSEEQRRDYARTLCEAINQWATHSRLRLSGRIFVSRKFGIGLVTITKGEQLEFCVEQESPEPIEKALGQIQRFLVKGGQHVAYLRGFSLFEKDRVHILKPLNLRHWTRTAALNDADQLVGAFLTGAS